MRAVEEAAPGSRLNLLLTDGATIWATAWRHALAVHTADAWAASVTVASEPTDAHPDWTQVPDRHLVVAPPRAITTRCIRSTHRSTRWPRAGAKPREHDDHREPGRLPRYGSTSISTEADGDTALRADVRGGLTAGPRTLPPKWFYDARGSDLFEKITRLPEYYPPAPSGDPRATPGDIAGTPGADTLVELGSGSSKKTRLLLDAIRAGEPSHVRAVDVSEPRAAALDEIAVGTPSSRSTASSPTSPVTWTSCRAPPRRAGAGSSPSWAARSATCPPPPRRVPDHVRAVLGR